MAMRSCLIAAALAVAAQGEVTSLAPHHKPALRHTAGAVEPNWPQVVDSAVYRSIDDEAKTQDVTKTVNRLIGKNGYADFTGGKTFNEAFGDPAYDEWKVLRVTKGDKTVELTENDVNNGGPLGQAYDLSELN